MKILHVATFIGNIGDNASHQGFHKVLEAVLPGQHQIDTLEIRKTYGVYTLPDKWKFDHDFAWRANQYDLILIGGGHFLDFWVPNSVTGTSLDIPDDVFDAIKPPLAIVSTGCMYRNEIPEENVLKFRRFLDRLLARDKTFIGVRNDGSKSILRDVIGQKYFEAIPEVLDSGFFYENDGSSYRPCAKDYVVLNSTIDQLLMKNRRTGAIDGERYILEMARILNHLLEKTSLHLVFAPHIYSDYTAFQKLLANVNDFHIRTRVSITPYSQGDYGCTQIFSAYRNARLVIGMRFHTNVCSLSMARPSVGLVATDRVINAYESVGLGDRCCRVDLPFADATIAKAEILLENEAAVVDETKRKVATARERTLEVYRQMVRQLGL